MTMRPYIWISRIFILSLLPFFACDSLTEEQKEAKVKELKSRAENYLDNNNFIRCWHCADEAIGLSSESDPELYKLKGICLLNDGLHKKSTKAFNEVIDLEGDSSIAYYYRAISYFYREKNRKFKKDINHYIEHHPEDIKGYKARARYFKKEREFKKLLADQLQIVELDSSDPLNYLELGTTYTVLGQNNKGVINFNIYADLSPEVNHDTLRLHTGELLFEIEDFEGTIKEVTQVPDTEIYAEEKSRLLSRAYFGMNDYENSLYYLDKHLELKPKNIESNFIKSKVLAKKGNSELSNNFLIIGKTLKWEQGGFFFRYFWLIFYLMIFSSAVLFTYRYFEKKPEFDRKNVKSGFLFQTAWFFGVKEIYLKQYFYLIFKSLLILSFLILFAFEVRSYFWNPNLLIESISQSSLGLSLSLLILILMFLDFLSTPYQVFASNWNERKSVNLKKLIHRQNSIPEISRIVGEANRSLIKLTR